MKTAIISDIHGNLEALQATLERIETLHVGRIVCLGDIVGYGASPNECVELLRERKIRSVVGNHDKAVTGELSIESFSIVATLGVEWTQSVITKSNKEFLKELQYTAEIDDTLFVHSSPDLPQYFRYLFTQEDAEGSFHAFDTSICFIGHTHRPAVFCEDRVSSQLVSGKRFIVNVGSVGQPRDGDSRGCFVLFDDETFSIEYVRVEYDVNTAADKIIKAGLPQKLADRLALGI